MEELKSCPFCGNTKEGIWPHGGLEIGQVDNPLVFLDSAVRGEMCTYVLCLKCGAMIKGDIHDDVVRAWNTRAGDDGMRHGRWEPYKRAPEWDQKQCSVCGDISCCQGNFCPNCGAKMDGEL